mmetsp:Transcript_121329/g.350357  ORF Transcript_121329/g.350357 Transcript_121329/m.350357 type:complete len:203 (+) Transcript_121329:175-783(+)
MMMVLLFLFACCRFGRRLRRIVNNSSVCHDDGHLHTSSSRRCWQQPVSSIHFLTHNYGLWWNRWNLFGSIAIASSIGSTTEPSILIGRNTRLGGIGFQPTTPLAQKFLAIFDTRHQRKRAALIKRSSNTDASLDIVAAARTHHDGFTTDRSAVNNGTACARYMIENNGWATANARDETTKHSCAQLNVVKEELRRQQQNTST